MPSLSVILIVRDEAHVVVECLESVRWADEILVLDSGSRDGTPDLCRRFTPKVLETDWPGFGVQKNRALAQASGDWVLSLDADERVTPALAGEIRAVISSTAAAGFRIPFQSTYLGRPMRFGDWRDERHLRLFRREAGRFTPDPVHERLLVDGPIADLKERIIHHSFASLDEVLDKVNRYSSEAAQVRLAQGRRGSLGSAIGHGAWTFLRGYLLRAGFLDGREGFLLALSNALGSFYRYAKLAYLRQPGGPGCS